MRVDADGGHDLGARLGGLLPTDPLDQLVDSLPQPGRVEELDLAYIGANGLSRDHGATTQDPSVAAVKSTAIQHSRRRIFFGAHTKFGAHSLCRFADVRDFEVLITGTELPAAEARRYAALGPQVVRT